MLLCRDHQLVFWESCCEEDGPAQIPAMMVDDVIDTGNESSRSSKLDTSLLPVWLTIRSRAYRRRLRKTGVDD